MFVGVYDGHSGNAASSHLQDCLWSELDNLAEFTPANITALLKKLDQDFGDTEICTQGSTIAAVLLTKIPDKIPKSYRLLVINVGDSRVIAHTGDEIVSLTEDHKPANP